MLNQEQLMISAMSNQITTKIIAVVEEIAGILYVLNLIAFPSIDLTMGVRATWLS
jgi:hypothetical protein